MTEISAKILAPTVTAGVVAGASSVVAYFAYFAYCGWCWLGCRCMVNVHSE